MRRALIPLSLGLFACNQYAYFNVSGFEQAEFSNDADILFVIDNSTSMREESTALALNFNAFIERLTSEDGAQQKTDNLNDAVDNFVTYVEDRGRFIDYQLGITTTTVDYSVGQTDGVDPGEAGLLLGSPPIIDKYDANVELAFRKNLLCEATYWEFSSLPSNLNYECNAEDPQLDESGEITVEYLDCVCGGQDWESVSGSGNEEPLEAALLALCRASDDPPDVCYDPQSNFDSNAVGTNGGFLRDDSTVIVVLVGDEGDNSRRMVQGDVDPQVYEEAFAAFERPVKFVTIGPNYDGADFSCNSGGAVTWAVERLQALSNTSGGFYRPLEVDDGSGGCVQANFEQHLQELGDLLNSLETIFRLQSIPDIASITVYVDGEQVGESLIINQDAVDADPINTAPEYGDGWSYSSAENAVIFWGESIPDYNQEVRIFYRPLEDNPRELPFNY